MSSEQVAWSMYAKLSARDRRAVDAWRDLGNDVLTSLLNADVLRSAAPTRFPADDLGDWARRVAGSPELERQDTCEHEAAHTVVARALGVHVREVTVAEDGRSGLTVHQARNDDERAIIAAAAEVWIKEFRAMVFPTAPDKAFRDDRTQVIRATGGDTYNVGRARRRARLILGERREEVLQLARQLAKDGHVTFEGSQ